MKAKRAEAALLKAEKKQLQKAGILLAEIGASKKSKQQLTSTIAWGVDYLNGGILLTTQNYNFTKAIDDPEYAGELRSLAPPWRGPAQPCGTEKRIGPSVYFP